MHFVFVSIAAPGHVNPTLPVVRELVDRGHRVSYATDEKLRPEVESAGATQISLPAMSFAGGLAAARPNDLDAAAVAERIRGHMRMVRESFRVFERHLEQNRPDAVCYDAMTLVGRFAAEKLDLPDIGLYPSYATNDQFTFASMLSVGGSGAFDSERMRVLFQTVRETSAELATEMGVKNAQMIGGPPASLNIVFIPRQFQFADETFDERFHFVGPSLGFRESGAGWQPPERPLLFVSLGTTPLNNKPDFFRTCLDAFADGPWRVAMSTGENVDQDELGPIPDNVEMRTFFPQLSVLRHTDVFLSHTGMNSTMESLYYGVPLVAAPQQPEQQANARQVEQLGLGRQLPTDYSADLLRQTVEEVHADDQIRGNVAEMSKVLHGCGGAVAAADAIEAHFR